jgi:hypothetical protein
MQERASSPRILIYTKHQVIWECQEANLTESGLDMRGIRTLRIKRIPTLRELE